MIAVVTEKVIKGALEFLGGFFDDVLDFLLRPDGEAVKKLTSKCPSWWFHSRPSPVHATHSWSIMAAICILPIINDDPRM